MTLNTSKKAAQRLPADGNNEFYVRAIAAWILLLIPAFLCALVFGYWLYCFVIAPIVISPLTIWTYDLIQFVRKLTKRSTKLVSLVLIGFLSSLLLAFIAAQVYVEPSASSIVTKSAPIIEPVEEETLEKQQVYPAAALQQAMALGQEASQIVQAPPHPLSIWESAQQKWAQAVQQLESIPYDADIYSKANEKLADYRVNHDAIVQRIETEKKAVDNYELAKRLIEEFTILASPVVLPTKEDLPILEEGREKLEIAISLFQAIPDGAFVFELAQEKISTYEKNYQDLESIIQIMKGCHAKMTFKCDEIESLWLSLLDN